MAAGDGWSARAEDAVLHGCIPVIIMDNVHGVFESILDWDSFGVRIKEDQVLNLPHILLAYSDEQVRPVCMVAMVWQWCGGVYTVLIDMK